jgi:ketosteroid isomerase-like protein
MKHEAAKAIFAFLFGLVVLFATISSLEKVANAHPADKATVKNVGINKASDMDETIIRSLMQAWLKAYNSKDIDALFRLYSPRIYYANNGNKLQTSVDAIKDNYQRQFIAAPDTRIEFLEELVSINGDIGYITGKYQVVVPQSDDETKYFYGRVLLIFERNANHSDGVDGWQLVVDFDNQGQDITKQDF